METELLTSQLTAGYAMATLIEWLKKQAWFPFVAADNARLNRAFAMLASFIAAIGLHATFDSEAGVLTIVGLTLSNVLHTGWAWIQQYAIQQASYKGLIKNGGSR